MKALIEKEIQHLQVLELKLIDRFHQAMVHMRDYTASDHRSDYPITTAGVLITAAQDVYLAAAELTSCRQRLNLLRGILANASLGD